MIGEDAAFELARVVETTRNVFEPGTSEFARTLNTPGDTFEED